MARSQSLRPALDVIRDHLRTRDEGRLDEDVATNYAEDVILLSTYGTYHGHEGIRESGDRLFRDLGPSQFDYEDLQVEDRFGFLKWSARSEDQEITDGADGFVVEDGVIVMQTVHYTVRPRQDRRRGEESQT